MTLTQAHESLRRMGHVALVRHPDHLCNVEDAHSLAGCPQLPRFRWTQEELARCDSESCLHHAIARKLQAHHDEDLDEPDPASEDEEDAWGCDFPGECLMPGSHRRSECHTAEMIESQREVLRRIYIQAEPDQLEEDVSRLRTRQPPAHLRYIYEPLADLVTSEHLRPYCCLADTVIFYPDLGGHTELVRTRHAWRADDVVESDGERLRLLSAKCVYRQGQWCMRWYARREASHV